MKVLYVLFLITTTASAQLHHQMLSSQGSTSKTNSGVIASQTIGQQSVTSNYEINYFKFGMDMVIG
jgi:hypothetical protein